MKSSVTDLLYSFYLLNDNQSFSNLYNINKDYFKLEIQNHFSKSYLQEISKIINADIDIPYLQNEIDDIFTEYAIYFYENANTKYLMDRGIIQKSINEFMLGSTHAIEDEEKLDLFLSKLNSKYDNTLVSIINNYHKYIFLTNLQTYNDIHCSTIPCFDSTGYCRGIVYRVEKYHPNTENIRNLYKFHVSHAPTYMFNQLVINNHDTLFLVEGVFDAISMIQLGYINTISVSHLKLSKFQIELIKDKNIIIIYDNDQGGLNGLEYFYQNYHSKMKSVKYYQSPNKDIDLLIRENPNLAIKFINTCNSTQV